MSLNLKYSRSRAGDRHELATVFGAAVATLVLLVLTLETWKHGPPQFIHTLDFIFHEAGHVFLWPFGQFVHLLGGTIGQLAVPGALACYFGMRRAWLSASVMVWWIGENLIDIARYIADAHWRTLELWNDDLLHDWHYLLMDLGLLGYAVEIGAIVRVAGLLTMAGAVLWSAGIFARLLTRP